MLMVIGTGISLWRYLAQSQVDSQTHAERRIIYLFILLVTSCYCCPIAGDQWKWQNHCTWPVRHTHTLP